MQNTLYLLPRLEPALECLLSSILLTVDLVERFPELLHPSFVGVSCLRNYLDTVEFLQLGTGLVGGANVEDTAAVNVDLPVKLPLPPEGAALPGVAVPSCHVSQHNFPAEITEY